MRSEATDGNELHYAQIYLLSVPFINGIVLTGEDFVVDMPDVNSGEIDKDVEIGKLPRKGRLTSAAATNAQIRDHHLLEQ